MRARVHLRLVATAAVVAALSACSADRPDTPSLPTPTPTPETLHFQPVEPDFCETARLDTVTAPFGLDVAPIEYPSRFRHFEPTVPGLGVEYWFTRCRFGARGADDWISTIVEAEIIVHDERRMAFNRFDQAAEPLARNVTVEPVEGWWDQGVVLRTEKRTVRGLHDQELRLDHHVYEDNLYVHVMVAADFLSEREDEAVPLSYLLGRSVLDRVIEYVPTDPPGD